MNEEAYIRHSFFCIERFEEEFAVCEDENRRSFSLPRALLPEESREGDWLNQDENGAYQLLPDLTKKRREEAAARLRALLGR